MKAKLLRTFLLTLLGIVFVVPIFLSYTRCQLPTTARVDSYEEVKQALSDKPDISFPDLSSYVQRDDVIYEVSRYEAINSYEIHFAFTPSSNELLEGEPIVSAFTAFASNSIQYYDKLNPPEPLRVTRVYRGVSLQEDLSDHTTVWVENKISNSEWTEENPEFPLEMFKELYLSCIFELDGYRYHVSMRLELLHDESEGVSLDEKIAPYREELFALVDSILDERGVAR